MKINNPQYRLKLIKNEFDDNKYYFEDDGKRVHFNIFKNKAIISFTNRTKWFKRKMDNYEKENIKLRRFGITGKVIPYRKYWAIEISLKQIQL